MKAMSLSAALAASLSIGSALAACSTSSAASVINVQLVDRTTGRPIAVHRHGGQMYVAGEAGERYAVRITNRTGARVMAVLSVDGVNAVTGETAGTEQNGYVLGPYQSYDVPGWRKSRDEVAAFYFTSLGDSYAARTDRPRNVGVVGVAVWREYLPPPVAAPAAPPAASTAPPGERPLQSSREARSESATAANADHAMDLGAASTPAQRAAPAAGAIISRPAEKLGTGHGERVASRVEYVHFERDGTQPAEAVQIFYDSRANLIARGIIHDSSAWNGDPDPFPEGRFVPDPRG